MELDFNKRDLNIILIALLDHEKKVRKLAQKEACYLGSDAFGELNRKQNEIMNYLKELIEETTRGVSDD